MRDLTAVFALVRLLLLMLAAVAAPSLYSQTITGSIVGTVVDPSGAGLVQADVTLEQVATGARRTVQTTEQGSFLFSSVQPGAYRVSVTAPGFKALQQSNVNLSASETLPLGKLTMELGALSDQITVVAQGVAVQTASSERAGVISSSQLQDLMTKGRNAMSLVSLMPGVVDGQGVGNTERIDRNYDISVQGNRRSANTVAVDGMPVNPMGNNFNNVVMLSQDAVAEVKVLLTNYPAEYGRSSGATINFVTRSGSRDFHGLVSYFKRHEQFNANSFFNNRLGLPKARYRYNTWNYNIGGPITLPHFNRGRDKLFFFWSQEFWPLTVPQSITQITVPTALERRGDFSQSLDLNGRLISVKDPLTGQPFPGNVIPTNRLDPSGVALLNRFPQANFFDRATSAGRYNYVFQGENQTPIRMENARVDYNLSAKNSFSFTLASYVDQQTGALGILTSPSQSNWAQQTKTYRLHGQGYILRYTGVFSPTLINETSLGFTRRPEGNSSPDADIVANQRSTVGFVAGQFNPASNPLNFIPNATFGGVTNAGTLYMEGRFPFSQRLNAFNLTSNLTKTWNTHTVKAGVMIERNYEGAVNDGNYAGLYSFGTDSNNPLDSGYAYANAALGNFATYTEASNRTQLSFRQHAVEWFGQDTWRATKRLTLEFGVRFHFLQPIYARTDRLSSFAPDRYNPARQVQLIRPVLVNGRRMGVDPITGTVYPTALIGAIAPNSGDLSNGLAVANQNGYPRGLVDSYGVKLGPRFGFAWDVFGNAKTAVRGGFGKFYNRPNMSDNYVRFASQLPLVSNPTVYYGNLSTLLTSAGAVFPQSINGLDRSNRVPSVMNFSLSVQQNIGFNTVVDVGYVGSLGRNLLWLRNLNPIPLGANFAPANADPSNPSTPLPQAFLRPIQGYNDILMTEPASSSNYHSMQVTGRRRFSSSLQFGVAWTWSKALNYADTDTTAVSVLVPVRVWNYGLSSYDRTHNVRIDWAWDLPKIPTKSRALNQVVNNWQLSGITSFVSGQPLGIGFTTVNTVDITGSASQGARINVTGDPNLPKDERTFSRNFRTEVFQLPARGTVGNSAPTQIRGPGINNWDMALFKDFPVREQMKLQFRAEAYNAFNHTQFSALDTTARFDATGSQVNTRFGEFTAARAPRTMQFALRFYF